MTLPLVPSDNYFNDLSTTPSRIILAEIFSPASLPNFYLSSNYNVITGNNIMQDLDSNTIELRSRYPFSDKKFQYV